MTWPSEIHPEPAGSPPAIMESAPGPEVVIDGRRYLYFGGTSYLGLAGHPKVIEAACSALHQYGVHTATSRSGFGTNPPTRQVELTAARFFGLESAFYFASGYLGNHILVQTLAGSFDILYIDDRSHYCVRESAHLAGLPVVSFSHRDPGALESQMGRHLGPNQRPLVLTDGVFPLTGALAPVPQYLELLGRWEHSGLMIDDAHGVGVLGDSGRGTLDHFRLWGSQINSLLSPKPALFVCGTLSKALGGFGGLIPGQAEFIAQLKRSSGCFDGASAPPTAAAAASAAALEILLHEPHWRNRLRENIQHMRSGLREAGLDVANWPTPNIGLQIGDSVRMRRIHEQLRAQGILIPYISNYAGSDPGGTLRIAVFATHTNEMIQQAILCIKRLL